MRILMRGAIDPMIDMNPAKFIIENHTGGNIGNMTFTNSIARTLLVDAQTTIDYLDGEPGVHSKRFLGENMPYYAKNRKILDMMRGVPEEERTCRFVCTMVLLSPSGKNEIVNGVVEGEIATKIAGDGGFGYDPIFFVPENACTLAQMPLYEKNKISHRARALAQIKEILEDPAWLEQY